MRAGAVDGMARTDFRRADSPTDAETSPDSSSQLRWLEGINVASKVDSSPESPFN